MTPVNTYNNCRLLWFTATVSMNMYIYVNKCEILCFQAMAELEDIQNMQGAVASTPALMDMSVPAEAGAVNINPE